MVNAGRVAIVPQGEWNADATYKRLDAVTHNNTLYFAIKEVPAGTATTNTEYWSKSIVGGAGAIATTEGAGIVKPDGTTITIDEDGTIHGQSEITVDGTTITLDEAKGIISLAKTLQDKIKTIDNKLPKTSVVNTNTTTEAGFALDARQANPNIAGTLAANILQLNNDSNPTDIGFEKISTLAVYESVEIIRVGKHLAWYNLWLSYAGLGANYLEESILRLHDIDSVHYITGGSCSIYGQQSCDNTGIIYSQMSDNGVELHLRVKGNLSGGFGVYATGIFVIG